MPTFEDPAKDADELGEAARGLAYATRRISVPDDTYRVLGSMHYALTSVQQSLGSWRTGTNGTARSRRPMMETELRARSRRPRRRAG